VISHNKAVGLVVVPPNGRYYFDNTQSNIDGPFRKVTDSSIGLSIKFFDNYYDGFIAPNGRYFELQPFITTFNIDRFNAPGGQATRLEDIGYKAWGLSAIVGDQMVVKDRLIPNFVFGFTFMKAIFPKMDKFLEPQSVRSYGAYNSIYIGRYFDQDEYYKPSEEKDYGFSFRVDLKIGIGALLF